MIFLFHFYFPYNCRYCAELDLLRYTPEDSSMSSTCPTLAEVHTAIKILRNGRASGSDNIPPEFLKVAVDPVSVRLHALIRRVWSTGFVPSEFVRWYYHVPIQRQRQSGRM